MLRCAAGCLVSVVHLCGFPCLSGAFVRVALPRRRSIQRMGACHLFLLELTFKKALALKLLCAGYRPLQGGNVFRPKAVKKMVAVFLARSCWQSKNDFSHAVSCFLPSYVTRY